MYGVVEVIALLFYKWGAGCLVSEEEGCPDAPTHRQPFHAAKYWLGQSARKARFVVNIK